MTKNRLVELILNRVHNGCACEYCMPDMAPLIAEDIMTDMANPAFDVPACELAGCRAHPWCPEQTGEEE